MHCSINLSSDPYTLSEFANKESLVRFYTSLGCDGIELILCGEDFQNKIVPGMVRGLHLIFYPEWINLWQNRFTALDAEFGSPKVWQEFYRAKNGEELLAIYKHELEVAKNLGVEYVVFHIGDNSLDEFYTLKNKRPAEEVVDVSCQLLNAMFQGEEYNFALLLENMGTSALNLTDPSMVYRLLEGVAYQNTGLMLDTGHLMMTNKQLATQPEACEYIHSVLDSLGSLERYIRGVHLHRSLQGAYQLEVLKNPPVKLPEDYFERFIQTTKHLSKADPHLPFTTPEVGPLIQRLHPEYLVHELSRTSKAQWKEAVLAQNKVIHNRIKL